MFVGKKKTDFRIPLKIKNCELQEIPRNDGMNKKKRKKIIYAYSIY